MTQRAHFLFVDDDLGSLPNFRLIDSDQRTLVEDISKISAHEVLRAHVVLCDFDLDEVPTIKNAKSASIPRNGLGLVAAIRSVLQGSNLLKATPLKAFVVLTNDAGRLTSLPRRYREYAADVGNDVDWIFDKPDEDASEKFELKLIALANAVMSIPDTFPENVESIFSAVKALLKIDQLAPHLGDRVWQDVLDAHPGLRDGADATSSEAFYRWLLRRALPFPTFVYSDAYLALRLRIDPNQLDAVLSSANARLLNALGPAIYRGVLHDFFERRWWAGAVEQILWEITDHRPFEFEALAELTDGLSRSEDAELVVVLGLDLQPRSTLARQPDVQGVKPSGWPSFAQQAWMSSADAAECANALEIANPLEFS